MLSSHAFNIYCSCKRVLKNYFVPSPTWGIFYRRARSPAHGRGLSFFRWATNRTWQMYWFPRRVLKYGYSCLNAPVSTRFTVGQRILFLCHFWIDTYIPLTFLSSNLREFTMRLWAGKSKPKSWSCPSHHSALQRGIMPKRRQFDCVTACHPSAAPQIYCSMACVMIMEDRMQEASLAQKWPKWSPIISNSKKNCVKFNLAPGLKEHTTTLSCSCCVTVSWPEMTPKHNILDYRCCHPKPSWETGQLSQSPVIHGSL